MISGSDPPMSKSDVADAESDGHNTGEFIEPDVTQDGHRS
jgi:hypothetical protein